MSKTKVKYIRGWRQVKAIYFFFECLIKGNILCAKRELEIMSGFAKPYKVYFHPLFWDSLRKLGTSEKEIDELKKETEHE